MEACWDAGNMTRKCTETCSDDGRSCTIEVDIHACTCRGRRLILQELATYDVDR